MAGNPSQTRPEPMNASPYHSKVKVTLRFADHQFAAGGMVTGKMELECKAEKGLGIGVILVELYAIEELTSRDHSATSTFLHSRRLFQGPGLPPSNSVHPYPAPGDPPLPSNYYHARRGITTFFFQFPLPESSPSSIEFGSGLARLRYEVRASVGVAWKGEKKLVTDKKPVEVVEQYDSDPVRGAAEGIIVGENGKIWMQGKVLGGFMVAGQPACIELQVKNHSSKKNSGLAVTLSRDLYLPNQPAAQKQPLQINDTVTSVNFRGPDYIIGPGVEGVANLVIDVPKHARGVRGGRRIGDGDKLTECLFEVRCTVGIKLSMGLGSKDIRLDLPVKILDPSVVPDYPPPDVYAALPPAAPTGAPFYDPASGMMYQPPTSPAPYLDRPTSPYAYPVPPISPPIPVMSPPLAPYIEHGQVWLPPPNMPFPNIYGQPSYYQHPGSMAPPLAPPPRPSSAEPVPSQPLHNLPDGPAAPPPPLIPFPTGGKNDGHREEGKGERASRISHHLRLSSRHRSASPPAHRFQREMGRERERERVNSIVGYATIALAPSTRVMADVGNGNGNGNATVSPTSSPELHTRQGLALSPLHTGGAVVSPRPMLSPKLSFSKDPLEQVSQVQCLERIAAEGRADDGEDADRDKTLPKPPVPSGKVKAKDKAGTTTPRGRADTLFPPELLLAAAGVEDVETPRTPTLAAVASTSVLKVPRLRGSGAGGAGGAEASSGLDALEARLLAEVGTRKPERQRAPDVRSVLQVPLPEPIAIPRAQDVEPPVDSAISSLTLGGLEFDVDEKTLKRGKFSRGGGSERGLDVDVELEPELGLGLEVEDMVPGRTRESTQTTRGRDSQQTQTQTQTERARKGSGGAKKGKHSSKHTAGSEGENKTKDKELQKLRKAAQGRITAWLGRIDADAEPPESQTPPPVSPSPRRGRSPGGVVAREPVVGSLGVSPARSPAVSPAASPAHSRGPSPARSARRLTEPAASSLPKKASAEVLANVAPSPPSPKAARQEQEQETETQAAPNPRSSGFLPIGTVRAHPQVVAVNAKAGKRALPVDAFLTPKASPRLGVYPPRPLDAEVKYDIRSARGGKGGIVTSVAAIWASATQPAAAKEAAPKHAPVPAKPRANATKLAEQWKATAEHNGPATPKGPPAMKPKPEGLRSPKVAAGEGLRSPPTGALTPTMANGRPRALQPLAKTGYASPTVTSPAADPMITSVADLTARRAKMIKSTSVPAVVSSSTATPMLSSTASLARPSPARAERAKMNTKLPPTIAEAEPVISAPKAQLTTTKVTATSENGAPVTAPGSPPAKADYAFGQARLRELIKRYQGQVSS